MPRENRKLTAEGLRAAHCGTYVSLSPARHHVRVAQAFIPLAAGRAMLPGACHQAQPSLATNKMGHR
jgi:hypothetical protein